MASQIRANWKMPLLLFLLVMGTGAKVAAASGGATLYAQRCAACHGRNGKGNGPEGAYLMPRPQPFYTALKGKSDKWLDAVITQGGSAVGLSPEMPAQPMLSNTEVNSLIQYIKHLGS
jgi:mono/diheme cytochrome c family protein